jgi:glycosyltransferase 2 family protein
MNRSRWLRLAGWLVLPLVFTGLVWDTGLARLQSILGSIQPWGLALLVGYNLVVMLLFSSRWWFVLRALGYRLPYGAVFRYRTAGFAISYLTPGSQFGGEPFQVVALTQFHGLPTSVALASVTLDKLFELLANFSFLAIGICLILQKQTFGLIRRQELAVGAAGLLAVPLFYLFLLGWDHQPLAWFFRRLSDGRKGWLAAKIRPLAGLAGDAERQIAAILRQRPRALVQISLAAGLIWVLSLSEYWLALRVLGAQLDLYQTVVALTAARLAFLTPLPGGLGALEAGQVFALHELGFDPALGIAISLWIRLRDAFVGSLGVAYSAQLTTQLPVQTLPSEAGD